jgi:mono/diheme cytochrome c family protein
MSKFAKHKSVLGAAALTAAVVGFLTFSSAPRAASQPMADGDVAKGKEVFDTNCALCHNAESEEALVGPGLKGLFKMPPHKLSDGTEHKEHTVEVIKNQVVNGGGAMAPMGEQVKGEDLDNLLAYLQTL